jgi:acyl-CoA synthetase (AMP-forming)/AMP-acid ligase II/thioesterase domain-containing protein
MISLRQIGSIQDIGLNIRWSPALLAQQVNRRAELLSKMNIRRGSLVAILHGGSVHFFADLFATWMVGATAACIDATLTDAELKTIAEFAKPAALLVDRAAPAVDSSIPVLDLDAAPDTNSIIKPNFHLDDPALVLFTSGTTGNPKGVVLSFRALVARISSNIAMIGKAVLSRALVTLPTHFGHGLIGNALTPLMNGGEIVLHPLGALLASNLGRIVDDYHISFMSSVPALWRIAKNHSSPPTGSSLARIHVGSAPLSAQLWSEIAAWSRAEVVNCYGLTETANWIAGASSKVDGIADGLVGSSWGSTLAITDDNGSIRSTGDGEIIVQSPGLMSGYLDRPDLTAAVLRDGWFHTGDRGLIDDNGRIWLTGRIKDEINRAGLKIQPAEIDLLLEHHPAVAEACTFAIADPVSGEAVATLVRLVKGASVSPASIRAWCGERMRQAVIPERWIFVDAIPRNARGKVNRDAVRRMFAEDIPVSASIRGNTALDSLAMGASSVPGCTVESETRETLSAAVQSAVERAWTAVLDRQTFAGNLSWSNAGGDSLNALRLWLRIEEMLGTHLSLEAMHPNATPSEIVAAVVKMLDASSKSASRPISDGTPLVFYIPPAEGDSPELARFRAAIRDRIRFVVIQYPSLREMIDAGADFEAIVEAAEAQIRARCPSQVCFLTGYSFGGFVAWETAFRLSQSGWQIAFLGLIDTRRSEGLAIDRPYLRRQIAKIRSLVESMVLRPMEGLAIVLRWFLAFLKRVKAFWLLGSIGKLAAKLESKAAFVFLIQLRHQSLRKWKLSSLPIPITLFRSNEFKSGPPDYGWGTKCSQVTVIPVGGTHLSLLTRTDLLRERLLEAVEQASRKTDTSLVSMAPVPA